MSYDEIIELANEYDRIRHIVCAAIIDHPDVMRGLHKVQSQNNYSWIGDLGESETREWSPEAKAYMVQQFRQLVAT